MHLFHPFLCYPPDKDTQFTMHVLNTHITHAEQGQWTFFPLGKLREVVKLLMIKLST